MNSFTYETNTRLEQQRQQLENLLHRGNCETVYRPSRLHKFWSQFINAVVHRLTAGDEPRMGARHSSAKENMSREPLR